MSAAELARLEAEARARKQRFADTLDTLRHEATLPNLAEEAARLLGNILPPPSLIVAARQNPTVTLVLAACMSWLVRQANTVPVPPVKTHAKRRTLLHKKPKETLR